jgi:hypothetical protein
VSVFRRDEREYGAYADAARDLQGEGGRGKADRQKGDLYSHRNVKSTSLRNLKDAIDTLRKGR